MITHSRPILILIAIAGLLSSCSRKDTLSKVWFFTYDDNASFSGIKIYGSKNLPGIDPILTPVSFVNLQKDGHFTAYLEDFTYGTWDIKDTLIQLTGHDKKVRRLAIHDIKKNEMTLDAQADNPLASSSHFEGVDNDLKEEENPFSLTNNRWRIKATHKETDQEISDRLRNHFRYWEKYFNWGITTDRKTLDVRSLAGPLKMYGNGFQLIALEEWDPEWSSLFYDREDATIAWNKLHYFFTFEKIAWAKTDHKFKMFVSAFQQVQRKID